MNLKFLSLALLLLFVVGCSPKVETVEKIRVQCWDGSLVDDVSQCPVKQSSVQVEKSSETQTVETKEKFSTDSEVSEKDVDKTLINVLNKVYEDYGAMNKKYKLDIIDCSKYPTLEYMHLELRDWAEAGGQHTAIWAPGSNEGKLGVIRFKMTNVGCTKLLPKYESIVVRNDDSSVVFMSDEQDIPFADVMYPEGYWYPTDWMDGNIPISGDQFRPVKITQPGAYTVWIRIFPEDRVLTTIGMEKMTFQLG